MGEMANTYNDPDDTNTLFAKNFQAVFDTNTDVADLLTTWVTATKAGLVDPSVFSQSARATPSPQETPGTTPTSQPPSMTLCL